MTQIVESVRMFQIVPFYTESTSQLAAQVVSACSQRTTTSQVVASSQVMSTSTKRSATANGNKLG